MKTILKTTATLLLTLLLLFSVVSCGEKIDASGLWKTATYRSDTTLGDGANTVKVELVVEEQFIVFTIHTDKATLGEAMYEHDLIDNVDGLFNVCNGMTADWKQDKAYWGFYQGDKYLMFGVYDPQAVTTGEPTYKIVYTISTF